jgi:uncharacterized RDD family membrane protein YckC
MDASGDGPRATDPLPSAGWWRRLLATLVDMLLFCAVSALLAAPLIRPFDLSSAGLSLDALVQVTSLPSWRRHAAGVFGVWVALWWGYFTVGWGRCGATPGKWLLGLRIVDHQERCPVGFSRAILRLVAYSVASSVTLGLGHLLVLLRRDRKALHDLLAGTRVVRLRRGRMNGGERECTSSTPATSPAPDR